jgi:hypothetical protein
VDLDWVFTWWTCARWEHLAFALPFSSNRITILDAQFTLSVWVPV